MRYLASPVESAAAGGGGAQLHALRQPLLWPILVLAVISIIVCIRTINVAGSSARVMDTESFQAARDLVANIRGEGLGAQAAAHDRTPGYALVLAGAALADPHVEQGLGCRPADRSNCRPNLFASLLVLQCLAAVGVFDMWLAMAWRLSGNWEIAALTLALAFIATHLGDLAGLLRAMIWYQFFFALFLLAALLAYQKRSALLALGSGTSLGLAALFEPAAAILLAPLAAAVLGHQTILKSNSARAWLLAPALIAGFVATSAGLYSVASWLGYDLNGAWRHILRGLSEHLTFSSMDPRTWATSLLTSIPLIGDWSLGLLPDLGSRVGRGGGMVDAEAMSRLFQEGLSNAGSPAGAVAWLLVERGANESGAYLWGLPPIFARGIWAGGGVVALFGLFHVRTLLAHARADGRGGELIVVLWPIIALFLINVLLTANAYWLNPMLPFLYAYAIAYVAAGL
jgi:hypothetical protein